MYRDVSRLMLGNEISPELNSEVALILALARVVLAQRAMSFEG